MIEIVFSDSACGSLKVAQHYGKGKYQSGGYIAVGVGHADGSKPTREEVEAARREAEEKARLAWEGAVPLGGNTADIYGFNLVHRNPSMMTLSFVKSQQKVRNFRRQRLSGG